MDYTQSFSERGRTVPAEDKLEKYYNSKANTKFLRYGPDHMVAPVQTKFYVKIDPFIRNTPDYIIMNKGAYFLEAKGCHDIAKFKIDDLKSYAKWNDIMPLSFFVFSTMYQKIIQFDIGQLRYLIKHIDGISAYVNGHRSQREGVRGRLTDAITYLCILWGMFDEVE